LLYAVVPDPAAGLQSAHHGESASLRGIAELPTAARRRSGRGTSRLRAGASGAVPTFDLLSVGVHPMSSADIPASLPVGAGVPLSVSAADLFAHGFHCVPHIAAAMLPRGLAELSSGYWGLSVRWTSRWWRD
jgi:hypothetical protein